MKFKQSVNKSLTQPVLRYSSEIDRAVNYNCTAPKRIEILSSVLKTVLKSRDRFGKILSGCTESMVQRKEEIII